MISKFRSTLRDVLISRIDIWLTSKGKVDSTPLSFELLVRSVGGYSEAKLSVPIQDFARDFRLLL